MKLRQSSLDKWFKDRGDYTHNINYDLNENSIIMDLGGYTGLWAAQMIEKYNPYVYILEPVPEYYNNLIHKFSANEKVKILNIGVSQEEADVVLYQDNDSTSAIFKHGDQIAVKFNTLEYVLKYWNIEIIDLLQVNIEGCEYGLLEALVDGFLLDYIKNIQIQFHEGVDDCLIRRDAIQDKLTSIGFVKKFDYPFVWESWVNTKFK